MAEDFQIGHLAAIGSSGGHHLIELRNKNAARIYLASLSSSSSRKNIEYTINMMATIASNGIYNIDSFPWSSLRREHVLGLMMILQNRDKRGAPKPATLRLYLVILKRIAEEAMHLGQIELTQYIAIKSVKAPIGSRLQSGRVLDDDELNCLFSTCSLRTKHDLRDAAILALMAYAGLRRAEVSKLQMADIDWQTYNLTIIGKRNKERTIPIKQNLLRMLARYILHVRGDREGSVFYRISKDGTVLGSTLSPSAIYSIVASRAAQANLGELKPHDLRRTFGTNLDRGGTSLKVIAELLGHASVTTTETYVYTERERLVSAINSLSDIEA
ncbi:site-specific integrase [Vibrio vulnificus]|uniref:tyrosine-type recombinase/integrase n=1 Tax=Vibrio parahaemolyticus TaxID=670 RepID=UPI0004DFCABD|nr:site-specific integrase [Vibrio parahaemolyticus]EGQ9239428.1 site-specific integrase [Vibrio vulnificus]EHD1698854.1 site-specific integrase [Vibrio vulnificus]EKZ9225804.1 site-specific integrase [Vibrio vulnificus]ELC9582643.1 site-specific integrase [Vibrio vulnificus]MCU8149836.1 site-specific integrase [Vibrio vulnificus]